MFRRLSNQFVAYGIAVTWLVGGVVAVAAYGQLSAGIRKEAGARLEDDVRSALDLLSSDAGWTLAGGEIADLVPVESLHPDVAAQLEPLLDAGGVGFLLVKDRGLCRASVRPDRRVSLVPLRDANRVPDAIRSLLFGSLSGEEATATVTIFEGRQRIATNVRTEGGRRATGTLVSAPVADRVLLGGMPWNDRAFVVNRWMLTCYLPIRSPTGEVIGMLYAGLEEGPYTARGREQLPLLLLLIVLVTMAVSVAAAWVGRRLVRPLTALAERARALGRGEDVPSEPLPARMPDEVRALSDRFTQMTARVTERTRQLAESRDRAERALRDYLEVLAFVAHELKSPVSGAISKLDLVDRGYVGEVPEKMLPTLAGLRRYLEHALRMAIGFNQLSRAESGGMVVRPAAIEDVRRELVEPTVDDHRDEAARRGMELSVTGGVSAAELDPELIRIALGNLVGNAVKYGRDGGAVRVELTSAGDRLVLAVRNDGVGVPKDRFGDLFRKFQRIRDENIPERKGSGIGLYLVRRIAELHGGDVGVEGEYGSWIRFRMVIPVRPPPAPKDPDRG